MKKQILIILGFTLLSLVFGFPILENISYWGGYDWDYSFFLHEAQRISIGEYGQIPLWNPYLNGGQPLLADPHSRFLSPSFAFVLAFGPVIGLKIHIFLYLVLGFYGMYLLSKELDLTGPARYMPSVVFMMSGFYALHISIGHTQFFSIAYIPLIYLFYLRSRKDNFYLFLLIPLLSLMVFDGGISILAMILIFLSLHALSYSIDDQNMRPILVLVGAMLGCALFTGIKWIPMIEAYYSGDLPMPGKVKDSIPLSVLFQIFFSRDQAAHLDSYSHPGLQYGWHEYGLYLGIIPVALAILGAQGNFLRLRWYIFSLFLSLILALGSFFSYAPWELLKGIPLIGHLFVVPSRWLLLVAFEMALLSGFGLQWLHRQLKLGKWNMTVSYVLVLIVMADLALVNGQIFGKVFDLPPIVDESRENSFKQVISPRPGFQFKLDWQGYELQIPDAVVIQILQNKYPVLLSPYREYIPYSEFVKIHRELLENYQVSLPYGATSAMFPAILNNYGVVNGYRAKFHRNKALWSLSLNSEVYITGPQRRGLPFDFTPNGVTIYSLPQTSRLVIINQNYDKGWQFSSPGSYSVKSSNGVISVISARPEREIELRYLPFTVIIGGFISLLFLYFFVLALSWRLVQHRLKQREWAAEELSSLEDPSPTREGPL